MKGDTVYSGNTHSDDKTSFMIAVATPSVNCITLWMPSTKQLSCTLWRSIIFYHLSRRSIWGPARRFRGLLKKEEAKKNQSFSFPFLSARC